MGFEPKLVQFRTDLFEHECVEQETRLGTLLDPCVAKLGFQQENPEKFE